VKTDYVRVVLDQGELEGVRLGDGVSRFMNVPYAEPPTGDLRFALAVPRKPRPGIRDATRPGSTPPQSETWATLFKLGATPGHIPGDDYLNLNVFTPDTDGHLPVAVYIHGGSWRGGNGAMPMYDGRKFARDGVVLVSINYRMGAEGFLYFEGGHRNLGYSDQIEALRWIQRNIGAFGGDPTRVTIFGQSAGGAAVAHLVSMPETAGLFAAAINQSGPTRMTATTEQALELSAALAEHVGASPTRDGFASIDPLVLLAGLDSVLGDVSRAVGSALLVAPVLDPANVPWHASGDPMDAFPNRVPVLGGFMAEEMLLFTWNRDSEVPEAAVLGMLSRHGSDPTAVLDALRSAHPELQLADLARKLTEYVSFIGPGVEWLGAARASGLEAWGYEFGWRTNAEEGRPGAYHVLDIPFVFDNLEMTHALQMTGPDAPQDLADEVHREWVSFMVNGALPRPQFTDVDSLRWFDTRTRGDRSNTTALLTSLLGRVSETA
jgi:para-nitrobenzyl esterase